jgi:hypothetical protein
MHASRLKKFQDLIAKAAVDADFRSRVAKSPREACKEFDLEPTQAELDKVATLVADLDRISKIPALGQDDVQIWSIGLAQFKNFTTLD